MTIDAPTISAFAGLVTSLAGFVWAVRRKP